MATIEFDSVSKRYPDGFQALSELDLAVGDGEFLVLVGPSGCGKSTALRMVAGLEDITEGTLSIAGKTVNALAPRDRDVAMVFQSYALYPHLSVRQNIAFGLKVRGIERSARDKAVTDAAALLDLTPHLDRKPSQLSGGQRQRVAMGRAIVRRPAAFLMDEPLSNLDAKLRVSMRAEITRLQDLTGTTTIYVTHDQVEAMTMGDRVAVLDRGRLQQVGPPRVLYERPDNVFVASFIGSPQMNLMSADVGASGETITVKGQTLTVGDPALSQKLASVGARALVGVRPEHFSISPTGDGPLTLTAQAGVVEHLGATLLVHLDAGREADPDVPSVDAEDADDLGRRRGELLAVLPSEADVASGERVHLSLAPSKLHVFDPDTGQAV
ncbi:MAG: sn-glycerol-3-phosphate ABC transporter ATP-binding protein UgpC [Pseudomonadota bacterium]